jgi:uncharacterized protein YhhL (DUF1145 family)
MSLEGHPFRRQYQLSDVWNAIKTERQFDYVFWGHITLNLLLEHAYRLFGRILVVCAVVLIFSLVGTGYFVVLPSAYPSFGIRFYFHAIFGIFHLQSFILPF